MMETVQERLRSEVSAWFDELTTQESRMVDGERREDVMALQEWLAETVLNIRGELDYHEDGPAVKYYELVLAMGGPSITARANAGAWASVEIVGEWSGCDRVVQHVWLPTLGLMLGEFVTTVATDPNHR
jgi:hypothetical protein